MVVASAALERLMANLYSVCSGVQVPWQVYMKIAVATVL